MSKCWGSYRTKVRTAHERRRNKAQVLDLEYLLAEAFIRRSRLEDELFAQQQLIEELKARLANANQDTCYCDHSLVSVRIDVDVTKTIPDWCSLPEVHDARQPE